MSYSLATQCWKCTKFQKCSDLPVLSGAVSGIHAIGKDRGHLGYGTIRLECQAYEEYNGEN